MQLDIASNNHSATFQLRNQPVLIALFRVNTNPPSIFA
jgi:hypothetical protein